MRPSRRAALVTVLLVLSVLSAGCGSGGLAPVVGGPAPGPDALGSLAASGAGHRFYEVYDPLAGPARGTMLLLHSGGWRDARGDARRSLAVTALTLRAAGWRVLNVSYTPGPPSGGGPLDPRPMYRDVVAFYDQVRRAYGGPVCAYGESAGAHLAALLVTTRPALRCAVLQAAPLDLRTLLPTTSTAGRPNITQAFGTDPATLTAWSPKSRWTAHARSTHVFATGAANDKVVPPGQLRALARVAPTADVREIPGSGSGPNVTWMHSTVGQSTLDARLAALGRWLDRVVPRPRRGATGGPRPVNTGTTCDTPPGASTAARSRLMLAGDAWAQASTPGQAIAATRGCSGAARWQDDGLSLWTLPAAGATVPAGTEASLVLRSTRSLRRVTARFRGFLAHPLDWAVGLYASSTTSGPIRTPVAVCDHGACTDLRRIDADGGALIAASGSRGDPDASGTPVDATFALPAGTRRLAWSLRCVAAAGCSRTPLVDGAGRSKRARDPLGHPAIFSVYRVAVR